MERILTALNIFFFSVLIAKIFYDDGAIKILVLAVSIFSFLYAVISGIFFWIDAFSFIRVLVTILIFVLSLVFLISRNRNTNNRLFKIKKPFYNLKMKVNQTEIKILHKITDSWNRVSIIEILLIVLALLLSFQNFELFSSGQDQGLYQAEAIELYMGNYKIEHDFEEYRILENREDKEAYLDMLEVGMPGYYPLSSYYRRIGFEMSKLFSDTSGMYHGIQTFPAILALGGKLFGLENMMQVQTVFLICSVLLLYYAFCNIGIPLKKRLAGLAVFILSPLVLWISKTAFTEMILTLCVVFYLFLLTEISTKLKRYLLILPLISFSFIHVSFLQIFPIFVMINVLLFFQSGYREYIWDNLMLTVGLAMGYSMMAHIGPQYFFDNVSLLFYKNIITINNFLYWIYLGCILIVFCSLLLLKIRNLDSMFQKIISLGKFSPILVLILLCFIAFNMVIIGYFRVPEDVKYAYLSSYYGGGVLGAISHSAFFAFAMSTGFFVILCVLWYVIRYHKTIWKTPIETAVYFLFIYCILFQSAFIRKEVSYYFYYSRYLVFYIPIIAIAFVFLLKQSKKSLMWLMLAFSIVFMGIFDLPLLQKKDQTLFEWENLLDLEMAISDDSAIILDSDMITLLGASVRAISGEAIFPLFSNVKDEIELLKSHYTNVYYLTSETSTSACKTLGESNIEIKYRDTYFQQNTMYFGGHFPLEYSAVPHELILYKTKGFIFDYNLGQEMIDFSLNGFLGAESTGRWINNNDASVFCYLPSDNYRLTISVNSLPLEELGLNSYTANVYINDFYIGDIEITSDNGGGYFRFDIPKEYILEGDNTLLINCEQLWSPAEYGSDDTRSLGIFVNRLMFTQLSQKDYIFNYALTDAWNFEITGFSGIEATGSWIDEHTAKITCYLPPDDYRLTVDVDSVPLKRLGLDNYTANIYINGIYLGDISITLYSRGGSYHFDVPKEYIFEGDNIVSINCEQLWSPAEYGVSDSRTLGIFVERVVFTPVDQLIT